jgi:tryptophan synthase alpha chain
MNRIDQLFQTKKAGILNIYFTAGFPNLQDTPLLIETLAQAGADMIEIGMPYSDPLADGETIQQSGMIALQNGMTLDLLFEQVRLARQKTEIPLILMGYFNQVMQYGEEKFFQKCQEVGIDGLILPDLPLNVYEVSYRKMIETNNLRMTFLITPQTEPARVRKADALSDGFLYMVSSAAITGAKTGISTTQLDYFQRIQKMKLKSPRLIGFGISNRETFETACEYANGAIIGSAFIKALSKSKDIVKTTHEFVEMVRPAVLTH